MAEIFDSSAKGGSGGGKKSNDRKRQKPEKDPNAPKKP
jgi:hypothetical protein